MLYLSPNHSHTPMRLAGNITNPFRSILFVFSILTPILAFFNTNIKYVHVPLIEKQISRMIKIMISFRNAYISLVLFAFFNTNIKCIHVPLIEKKKFKNCNDYNFFQKRIYIFGPFFSYEKKQSSLSPS